MIEPTFPQPAWQHLKPYGYAPGYYVNRCHLCKEIVLNLDKRAITCRPCAEILYEKKSVAKPIAYASFSSISLQPTGVYLAKPDGSEPDVELRSETLKPLFLGE